MCGIAGFLGYGGLPSDTATDIASRMGDAIRHRGPDDAGIWCDDAAQVALAHRRLSILDLSPAGHQPMVSASGRFVMVFNGEIYNHLELRAALEKVGAGGAAGMIWRGHSDTETLLAGIRGLGAWRQR
jgi:asparagine synthase (glutamine-hydrolysing)